MRSDYNGENMARELLDEDGENQAVRMFLLMYGGQTCTVGGMQQHMKLAGYSYWPDWVGTADKATHLSKGGAQDWLRYLFGLEETHNAEGKRP